MSNRSSIDWLELDRLVDGRLDGDAYRELLCQIDSDPDGWRQCAMAFLEHQALTKELSVFSNDPSADMLPFVTGGVAAAMADEDSSPSETAATSVRASSSMAANSKSGALIGWLTMALCIIGGTALGFTLNSEFQDRLLPQSVPMNTVESPFANAKPEATIGDVYSIGMNANAKVSDKDSCETKAACKSRCMRRPTLQTRNRGDLNVEALEGCGAFCPSQGCDDEDLQIGRRR